MSTEPNGAYGPLPRKEDARFIRGRGTFVDDIQLPGMLYGAILRSPVPHARITAIDTVAAEAHPRVEAVVTGQDLAALGLAWMPTLSQDAQAVLATDKVDTDIPAPVSGTLTEIKVAVDHTVPVGTVLAVID